MRTYAAAVGGGMLGYLVTYFVTGSVLGPFATEAGHACDWAGPACDEAHRTFMIAMMAGLAAIVLVSGVTAGLAVRLTGGPAALATSCWAGLLLLVWNSFEWYWLPQGFPQPLQYAVFFGLPATAIAIGHWLATRTSRAKISAEMA